MLFGFFSAFVNIIAFLKGASRVSVWINVVLGCVLLAIGLFLLLKQPHPIGGRKAGGMVCVSLGGLALLGAVSTFFFASIL